MAETTSDNCVMRVGVRVRCSERRWRKSKTCMRSKIEDTNREQCLCPRVPRMLWRVESLGRMIKVVAAHP